MEKENKATSSLIKLDTIDDMIAFGDKLIKSGLTPMKKAEDVMAAILMGRTLGFAEVISVNNIYSINGRASIGIHMITSLLLKAGVPYKILEDYIPLYRYKDKSKIVRTVTNLDNIPREEIEVDPNFKDFRTTIQFKRKLKMPDGSYEPLEINQSLTMLEIKAMGLLDRDQWMKMPRIMLRTRCLTMGARLIAPDVLLGINEHTELADFTPTVKAKMSEDGTTSKVDGATDIEFEEVKEEKKDNNNPVSSEVPTTEGNTTTGT